MLLACAKIRAGNPGEWSALIKRSRERGKLPRRTSYREIGFKFLKGFTLKREKEGGRTKVCLTERVKKRGHWLCYTSLLMRVSRLVERDEIMRVNVFEEARNFTWTLSRLSVLCDGRKTLA